jgi:hypothetical protein
VISPCEPFTPAVVNFSQVAPSAQGPWQDKPVLMKTVEVLAKALRPGGIFLGRFAAENVAG